MNKVVGLCLFLFLISTVSAQTQSPIRVNAGGSGFSDSSGHWWDSDFGYNCGQLSSSAPTANVVGTSNPILFKSARYSQSTNPELQYQFSLANGTYKVNLYFAETFFKAAGKRIFDVQVQGSTLFRSLDIFAAVGADHVLVKSAVVSVTDGKIAIRFVHIPNANHPVISGIEIIPVPSVSLSGSGVQPQIAVTPASVSFGSVPKGVTNTQTVTISNPGTATLSLTHASESGVGFAYSGLALPLSVAAGRSSTFTVSFDPTVAGAFSGTLTLANNSPTASVAIALSGTGVAAVRQLSLSPTSLSFGDVARGTSSSKTVSLTNTGNASVSLSSDSVTGTSFSVSGLGLPLTLNAGQSTSFSVSFAPTAVESVSGSVSIVSNASTSPLTILLSGSGTSTSNSATLSWTPSSSSFKGFNVYRSTVSGGPYTKLDTSLITTESYPDTNVTAGQTYYYVITEVNTSGDESAYSAQVSATIP